MGDGAAAEDGDDGFPCGVSGGVAERGNMAAGREAETQGGGKGRFFWIARDRFGGWVPARGGRGKLLGWLRMEIGQPPSNGARDGFGS